MKKCILNLTVAALITAAFAGQAFADATATQVVSYEVAAIDQISVTGSPSLVVNSATAGGAPQTATAAGTYAITTNGSNRKITGSIDTNMPADTQLTLTVAAPDGAASAGVVTLSTTATDLVTGVTTVNQSGLSLSYQLSATVDAGVVPAGNKTVTYTVTAGA